VPPWTSSSSAGAGWYQADAAVLNQPLASCETRLVRYVRVEWHHEKADEPVVLYSEIDPEGWERRKVDAYADGRLDFADDLHEVGTTWLSDQPHDLSVEEIDAMPEFSATEISRDDFEMVWRQALTQPGPFTLAIERRTWEHPLDLSETASMAQALLEFQPASRAEVVGDPAVKFRVAGAGSPQIAPAILEIIAETVGAPFRIKAYRER